KVQDGPSWSADRTPRRIPPTPWPWQKRLPSTTGRSLFLRFSWLWRRPLGQSDRRLVLPAIQSNNRNVQAKNGNTPYSVSLTECDFRSTAKKTRAQKASA